MSTTAKSSIKKPKSPSAPSKSLKDSYEDTCKIYETYTHGKFTKAEVASVLGQSAGSGGFFGRYYTLQQYGLIEPTGESNKVTELFMTMKANQPDSANFKQSALTAIRRSLIFNELLQEFREKLPPQKNVAQRLESQKKFNPDKAKNAASVLERSLQFAGVIDANGNILPIRESDQTVQSISGETNHEPNNASEVSETYEQNGKTSVTQMKVEVPFQDNRKAIILISS